MAEDRVLIELQNLKDILEVSCGLLYFIAAGVIITLSTCLIFVGFMHTFLVLVSAPQA